MSNNNTATVCVQFIIEDQLSAVLSRLAPLQTGPVRWARSKPDMTNSAHMRRPFPTVAYLVPFLMVIFDTNATLALLNQNNAHLFPQIERPSKHSCFMKLPFLIALFSLFLSHANGQEKPTIVLGSGGGITGMATAYSVLPSGKVYKGKGKVQGLRLLG